MAPAAEAAAAPIGAEGPQIDLQRLGLSGLHGSGVVIAPRFPRRMFPVGAARVVIPLSFHDAFLSSGETSTFRASGRSRKSV